MSSTPMAPVSLDNTLNGMDPQTLSEALAAMQAEQLAQQSAQANQAAQQAGQQYQQAAQAPPPGLDAMSAFIPQLLSNVASVIGKEPSYRENRQDVNRQQQADLLKNRADNLQALRDVWSQKAEVAKQAGDLETTEKAHTKREQIDKALQQILDKQRHENALSEISARAEAQKGINAAKPAAVAGVTGFDPGGVAAGILDGTVPPDSRGFSRGQWGAIVSQIRKVDPKYNLMKAMADYTGVIQYVKTLNGNQQVTLRQRSQNAMTTADYITELIDEIKKNAPARTDVTKINKGQLDLVKNGAWGPDAADAATKLGAQIAAWRLEMAAVYSGGYAPQAQHLKEANDLIDPNWALHRIEAGLLIGKRDTNIRLNAINQMGTAGPSNPVVPGGTGTGTVNIGPNQMPFSQGEAAAPPPPPPGPANPIKVKDKKGKLWVIDQSELKEAVANGWKRAQ